MKGPRGVLFYMVRDLGHFVCYYKKMNNVNSNMNNDTKLFFFVKMCMIE